LGYICFTCKEYGTGVNEGYSKKLILEGVGFKSEVAGIY
jgi:ribosomal protein L6P/L9E